MASAKKLLNSIPVLKKALTIAASDPSGGAGIEADLKVFAAHGVFGMSAITGITIQGPKGIRKIIPTPVADFRKILGILAEEMKPDAVKIGALLSLGHLRAVREFLSRRKIPAVFDPLLKSGRGYPLLEKRAWKELVTLFPLVSLVTPNLPEAEAIAGMKVAEGADTLFLVEALFCKGADSILLKGGHLPGDPEDLFWSNFDYRYFRKRRLAGKFHGTGCALSSAIAAHLALGLSLKQSVARAEKYIERTLKCAVPVRGVKYLRHA